MRESKARRKEELYEQIDSLKEKERGVMDGKGEKGQNKKEEIEG